MSTRRRVPGVYHVTSTLLARSHRTSWSVPGRRIRPAAWRNLAVAAVISFVVDRRSRFTVSLA